MRRRNFLAWVCGTALAWPLSAIAQPGKIPRVGVLMLGNPDPAFFLSTFREELRKRGFIEGQSIAFELRSAGGSSKQLPSLARELVDLKVDTIVAYQTPCVAAAKQATTEIPIIMSPAADPIGTGFVASLGRPGGNITGISSATGETASKLDLIREVLPVARRIVALGNLIDPFHEVFVEGIMSGGRTLDIEIKPVLVRGSDEFESAFGEMVASGVEPALISAADAKADGLLILSSPLFGTNPKRVADLARKYRLPAITLFPEFAQVGGLMAYGTNLIDLFYQAGVLVGKVLDGSKPEDLAVERPTRFQLVVNLRTAKALGLTISTSLLLRADEVIE